MWYPDPYVDPADPTRMPFLVGAAPPTAAPLEPPRDLPVPVPAIGFGRLANYGADRKADPT